MEKERYLCTNCGKDYSTKCSLDKHVKAKHDNHRFNCEFCPKSFTDRSNWKRHEAKHVAGDDKRFQCEWCLYGCDEKFNMNRHLSKCRSNPQWSAPVAAVEGPTLVAPPVVEKARPVDFEAWDWDRVLAPSPLSVVQAAPTQQFAYQGVGTRVPLELTAPVVGYGGFPQQWMGNEVLPAATTPMVDLEALLQQGVDTWAPSAPTWDSHGAMEPEYLNFFEGALHQQPLGYQTQQASQVLDFWC